eukprot:472769-Amphidinium_carterae.1
MLGHGHSVMETNFFVQKAASADLKLTIKPAKVVSQSKYGTPENTCLKSNRAMPEHEHGPTPKLRLISPEMSVCACRKVTNMKAGFGVPGAS